MVNSLSFVAYIPNSNPTMNVSKDGYAIKTFVNNIVCRDCLVVNSLTLGFMPSSNPAISDSRINTLITTFDKVAEIPGTL